jgi:ribosomal protein S13
MVRILGNNLSNKKKIYIALTCIYGIGIPTSKKILNQLNILSESNRLEIL